MQVSGAVTFNGTNNPNGAVLGGNVTFAGTGGTFIVGDSLATGALVDLDVTAVLSGAPSGGLIKGGSGSSGYGNMRLSGANTFTAPVTVSAGVLTLANSQALGAVSYSGTTTVSGGATLALDGSVNGNLDVDAHKTISIQGLGAANSTLTVGGALVNLNGNNTLEGPIVMPADATVASASGTLTLNGVISLANAGTNNFNVVGSGNVVLGGPPGRQLRRHPEPERQRHPEPHQSGQRDGQRDQRHQRDVAGADQRRAAQHGADHFGERQGGTATLDLAGSSQTYGGALVFGGAGPPPTPRRSSRRARAR